MTHHAAHMPALLPARRRTLALPLTLLWTLLAGACGSEPTSPFFGTDATGIDGSTTGDAGLDDSGVDDATDDTATDAEDDATTDTTDDATTDTAEDAEDAEDAGDASTDGSDDADAADDTSTDTGEDTDATLDVGEDTATDTTTDVADDADTATDTGEDTATDTGEDTATDTGEDTATDTGEDTTTDTGDSAPTIVTLEASRPSLTEGGTITLTAIVTDPDGADDVVAGTLADVVDGSTFQSFAPVGGAAWSVTVSWDELNELRAITFDAEGSRLVQVRFFDNAGNTATQTFAITLTCDGLGACDGACTDLDADTDCGGCGNLCAGETSCIDRACGCPADTTNCDDRCVPLGTTTDCLACGDVCADDEVCSESGCGCPPGEGRCDGVCTRLDTEDNCGSCGVACDPDGWMCIRGSCQCPGDGILCDGACANPRAPDTCGAGCTACADPGWCDGNVCQDPMPHELRIGATGALEVFFADGAWHSVCGTDFDEFAAAAACRQLGGELISYETGIDVDERLDFALRELDCGLTEGRLTACRYLRGVDECAAAGGVTVSCTRPDPIPEGCSAVGIGVVRINEIRTGSGDDAFIELYGPPGRTVDGLRLEHWDRFRGTIVNQVELSGTLNGDGYALIAGATTSATDRVGVLEGDSLSSANGGVRLVNCDRSVVDAVDWGSTSTGFSILGEGFEAPYFLAWNSFGRFPDGTDTDVNVDDIVQLQGPTPLMPNTEYFELLILPETRTGSIFGGEPSYTRPTTSCGSGASEVLYDQITRFNPYDTAVNLRAEVRYYDDNLFTGTEELPGVVHVYVGGFDPMDPTGFCADGDQGQPAGVDVVVPARTRVDIIISRAVETDDIDEWRLSLSGG